MQRALRAIEILLYIAFLADCFVLLVGVAHDPKWEPDGGVSLIVILLLIGVVQRLRGGKNYDATF